MLAFGMPRPTGRAFTRVVSTVPYLACGLSIAQLAVPVAALGTVQTPWGDRVQRSGGEKPGAAAAAGGCFVLVFHCTL